MIANSVLSRKVLGIVLVVTSAIAFSTAGLFSKGVEAGSWDIIFWRGIFAAGFTTLWAWQLGQLRESFINMGISGFAVAVAGALGTSAFIAAFKLTSVANVSLIYAAAPLLAALLAWIWIGEKASKQVLMGALLAMTGVTFIVSGSFGSLNLKGDLLALGMSIAMATIMVIYRRFPSTPGAGPAALSSLLLVPIALVLGNPLSISLHEIILLSGFGLLFAVASVTLAEGAKHLPSGQTALISTLEVPLAPVLAFLVLEEVPKDLTIFGGSIVLIAVLFAAVERK